MDKRGQPSKVAFKTTTKYINLNHCSQQDMTVFIIFIVIKKCNRVKFSPRALSKPAAATLNQQVLLTGGVDGRKNRDEVLVVFYLVKYFVPMSGHET